MQGYRAREAVTIREKLVESILFLCETSELKISVRRMGKFLYLANLLHLREYGREIYKDCYTARAHGMVGVLADLTLNLPHSVELFGLHLAFDCPEGIIIPHRSSNKDALSISDTNCLTEVVKLYSLTAYQDLITLSQDRVFNSLRIGQVINVVEVAKRLGENELYDYLLEFAV